MIVTLPGLDPEMDAIRRDGTRCRAVNAARQRGKGALGLLVAIDAAWNGSATWWLAPTFPQSDVSFTRGKRLLVSVPGVEVSESRRQFTFPSGGTLAFKSGDQRENLRGATLGHPSHPAVGLVGDEWAFADPDGEMWSLLRPMLSVRRARAMFLSTPRAVGDAWHAMVLRGDPTHPSHDPEWRSWTLSSEGSPYITADELAAARRSMPELDYRREYCAEFVSSAGALVPRSAIREAAPPSDLTIGMGVDLAISTKSTADFTAAVVLGRAEDGKLYVLDAVQARVGFADALALVERVAERWHPAIVNVEQAGLGAAHVEELLRRTSLPIRGVKITTDKVTRFQPIAARYEQALIFHAPGLTREFEECITAFPHGRHDDFADALSLAFDAASLPKPLTVHETAGVVRSKHPFGEWLGGGWTPENSPAPRWRR